MGLRVRLGAFLGAALVLLGCGGGNDDGEGSSGYEFTGGTEEQQAQAEVAFEYLAALEAGDAEAACALYREKSTTTGEPFFPDCVTKLPKTQVAQFASVGGFEIAEFTEDADYDGVVVQNADGSAMKIQVGADLTVVDAEEAEGDFSTTGG